MKFLFVLNLMLEHGFRFWSAAEIFLVLALHFSPSLKMEKNTYLDDGSADNIVHKNIK